MLHFFIQFVNSSLYNETFFCTLYKFNYYFLYIFTNYVYTSLKNNQFSYITM